MSFKQRLATLLSLTTMLFALSSMPAWGAAPKPRVLLTTTMGDITIELEQEKAPLTVNNFLTYMQFGNYNGTIFHRVINGFVIQGGGFTSEMLRTPARAPIENESDNGLSNLAGTIAMARTGDPHSATNQFYINLRDNKALDYGGRAAHSSGLSYTVFGRVVAGMDVVNRIGAVATGSKGPFPRDVPKEDVVLVDVKLITTEAQ